MEFFEFDNSFIGDFNSRSTSLSGDAWTGVSKKGDGGLVVSCKQVATLKAQGMKVGGDNGVTYDCVKDLPRTVTGKTPSSTKSIYGDCKTQVGGLKKRF